MTRPIFESESLIGLNDWGHHDDNMTRTVPNLNRSLGLNDWDLCGKKQTRMVNSSYNSQWVQMWSLAVAPFSSGWELDLADNNIGVRYLQWMPPQELTLWHQMRGSRYIWLEVGYVWTWRLIPPEETLVASRHLRVHPNCSLGMIKTPPKCGESKIWRGTIVVLLCVTDLYPNRLYGLNDSIVAYPYQYCFLVVKTIWTIRASPPHGLSGIKILIAQMTWTIRYIALLNSRSPQQQDGKTLIR